MNRRNVARWGLCALAAVAAGCAPLSGVRPAPPTPAGKSAPAGFDNPPGVVPAGGVQSDPLSAGKFDLAGGQPVGAFQGPAAVPGQPLQTPRPVPGAPGAGAPAGLVPQVLPGDAGGGPNVRSDPTWNGGRLGLRPGEVPTDRVIDLTRQLELVLGQNRELVARITELERQGAGREQALVEALREVEAAEAEVAKARGIIGAQKSELTLLQERVRRMEQEDIELLRLVIAALEKALPPAGRQP